MNPVRRYVRPIAGLAARRYPRTLTSASSAHTGDALWRSKRSIDEQPYNNDRHPHHHQRCVRGAVASRSRQAMPNAGHASFEKRCDRCRSHEGDRHNGARRDHAAGRASDVQREVPVCRARACAHGTNQHVRYEAGTRQSQPTFGACHDGVAAAEEATTTATMTDVMVAVTTANAEVVVATVNGVQPGTRRTTNPGWDGATR